MSRALLTSSAPVQHFSGMECAPCAALAFMQRRHSAQGRNGSTAQRKLTLPPQMADFAVDSAAGAVLLGGASEVLVPVSLVRRVEWAKLQQHQQGNNSTKNVAADWDALLHDRRVVVLLDHRDVSTFLTDYPSYTNLCVPVPAGGLAAKMFFGTTEDRFYSEAVPALTNAVAAVNAQADLSDDPTARRVQWRAWMRSSLTCRYEGPYVPPIRVSEHAAALMREEGGCSQLVLEEGVAGLTPRWLETVAKTALSCGVPTASVTLALCSSQNAPRLLNKAVEVGVTRFATCSLTTRHVAAASSPAQVSHGLFDGTQPLLTAYDLNAFAIGYGEGSSGEQLQEAEEDALQDSADYVESLSSEWAALASECAEPAAAETG